MAILTLNVLFVIALMLSSTSTQNVVQSGSQRDSHQARLATESGIAFLAHFVPQLSLSSSNSQAILDDLAAGLTSQLATGVSYNGSNIIVYGINPDSAGGTFAANIFVNADDKIQITVTGTSNEATHTASIAFGLAGGSGVFDCGVLLGGKLRMTGNASITGANDPSEAQVLTVLMSDDECFKMTGNCDLEGDLNASNPDGYASLSGNITIGGASKWSGDIDDHIHFGVPVVELPRPDPTVFEPFAVNVLSGSTSGNRTFTNIRIPANTNPTFSGNTTLEGVIYIEQPNNVHFSGNVSMKGVIVTEDAGQDAYASNTIKFTGNSSFEGVEALPDTAEFAGLKAMPGAAILAPGFDLRFTGNFGTVGGTLAAEKFTFTGNSGGVVKGAIISYSDEEMTLTGNSSLIIDRSAYDKVPPGFSVPTTLAPVMSSYTEE